MNTLFVNATYLHTVKRKNFVQCFHDSVNVGLVFLAPLRPSFAGTISKSRSNNTVNAPNIFPYVHKIKGFVLLRQCLSRLDSFSRKWIFSLQSTACSFNALVFNTCIVIEDFSLWDLFWGYWWISLSMLKFLITSRKCIIITDTSWTDSCIKKF
jgi:hypothetical protein